MAAAKIAAVNTAVSSTETLNTAAFEVIAAQIVVAAQIVTAAQIVVADEALRERRLSELASVEPSVVHRNICAISNISAISNIHAI
jgi:hypothetical protein